MARRWTRGQGADRGVGAEADTRWTGRGQRCRHRGGHEEDRGVGAEADTRTGGGQRCRLGGGHEEDRTWTEVSAWRQTRGGQDVDRGIGVEADTRTADNMTVSKHKLICEEEGKTEKEHPINTGRDRAAKTRTHPSDLASPNASD